MKLIQQNVTLPQFLVEQVQQLWKAWKETDGTLQLWKVYAKLVQPSVEAYDLSTGLMRRPPRPTFARFCDDPAHAQFPDSAGLFRAMDRSPLMLWAAAPNNACVYANRQLTIYTGRSVSDFLHMAWAEGLHPDDRQRTLDICRDGFISRRPFQFVYRLRRADGLYGWIFDQAELRHTPDGAYVGYIGSMHELTTEADASSPVESVIPPNPIEARDQRMAAFLGHFGLQFRALPCKPAKRARRSSDVDIVIMQAKASGE